MSDDQGGTGSDGERVEVSSALFVEAIRFLRTGGPRNLYLAQTLEEDAVHGGHGSFALSPEEVQLLVDIAAEKYDHGDPETWQFDELLGRLRDYGKEHHAGH